MHRSSTSLLAVLCLAAVFAVPVHAQTRIVVNADLGRDTISRFIYGNFSEHLGHCIYGGFYVGDTCATIPNTRGIRNDVVDALRKIKIPVLRWPGGCFADTYHWKDGIGPKENRPSIVNVWWGKTTEDNSFGTHEFLDLCEQLGAEPYISGNVGSGTVQELTQWVQYVNFNGVSPMSRLREKNGHPAPWKVKFWGLGNEAWGCGGSMTAEYYANVYRTAATFMTGGWGDGRLFRIASGASADDYHWTEVLMRDIPHGMVEALGLHYYAVIDWGKKSSATEFTEQEYFTTMQRALFMEELVRNHSTIMDRYDPKKDIALAVDEWGGWYDTEPGTNPSFLYQQNTMRDAMIAGLSLNIFNNHCDRVRMANIAQTINVLQAVLLTDGPVLIKTPTYHVFEMYTVHQGALMLPLTVAGGRYAVGHDTLQAVSASASRDKNGDIHVSLVNIDAQNQQEVTIDMRGVHASSVSGRVLASKHIQDHNTASDLDRVVPRAFGGATLNGGRISVQMPPCSVVVLTVR